MKGDPKRYEWLRSSEYASAGCVTVVAAADAAHVRAAFGCSGPALGVADEQTLAATARVAATGNGLVVVEDNGFQGARPEVLRPVSNGSSTGNAASIFWYVNDVIVFSCARRGKVVCSFELGEAEADIVALPAALRALTRQCREDDADLVAIGAAMVETFTGIPFTPGVLRAGDLYELTPAPADLDTDTVEHSALSYSDPDLHRTIVGLPGPRQRQLAEWAALAAVTEAGLSADPAVSVVASQFGQDQPTRVPPALEARAAGWERAQGELGTRDMLDESDTRLDTSFASQARWAGEALRYTSHPDPMTAAMHTVRAALLVFSCSRLERAGSFVEDRTGRHSVEVQGPVGRESEFRTVLARLLATDPNQWGALLEELPTPWTPSERTDAVRRDREREEAGDFDTWQYG